jgi:hypothetical protein
VALNAAIVWEVQTGGSDSNGGGFKTGATGTDRTLSTTARATLTTASTVNATTTIINVAAGDYTVSATDVGNVLQVTGGTATAGFYEITSADTVNNRWTVDRAVGTAAQTVAGAMGGCLASGGKACGPAITGHIVYVKNGTYTITTATTDVAGGVWFNGTFGKVVLFVGYGTTRTPTNTDTRPLIQYQAALSTATFTNSAATFVNLALDGNNNTAAKNCGGNGTFWRCSFTGFTTAGGGPSFECSATANSAAVFNGSPNVACEAYANTASPFTSVTNCVDCLSYNNTGASTDGFGNGYLFNCVAYGNGRDGFRPIQAVNCHAEANAGVGFSLNSRGGLLLNCSGYNNTGGLRAAGDPSTASGLVTVTSGSVFTNAAGNDFSLNATALRGALLRAAGVPGTYPRGTTRGYLDIGAAQHADPASGISRARALGGGL